MPYDRNKIAASLLMGSALVLFQITGARGQDVSDKGQVGPEEQGRSTAEASLAEEGSSAVERFSVEPLGMDLAQVTPGEQMTFAEAIAAADERNLTLSAARLEVEKARAQVKQALGLILPILQAGVQYIHNDHEDTINFTESLGPLITALGIPPSAMEGEGDYIVRRQEMANGSIQARIALIEPKSWFDIKTAKKGVTFAESSVSAVRQELLFGVAKAYFLALMSQTLVELHKDQIRSTAHHLTTARARLEAGVGIRIDVIRAETDLEQDRQRLHSSLIAFDNTRDTLGHLTGAGGLPMPVAPKQIPDLTESNETLISDALERRHDLKAKQKAIELAKCQLDAAWMQFLPTLDAAWQFQYQFTDPPDMGSDDKSRWAAILTLTVPIYNHFRYGDLDHKRAVLRQAEIQAEDAKSSAALEIRKTRRKYLDALSTVEIAEKRAGLASEALDLVEESYAAGTGSSLEVTDARRTASAADINLATQHLKAELALLDLLQSIGEDIAELPSKGVTVR